MPAVIVLCVFFFVMDTSFSHVTRLCYSDHVKSEIESSRAQLKLLLSDIQSKIGEIDANLYSIKNDCDKQWKTYNGNCYYFGEDLRTWFEADLRCNQLDSFLVKIEEMSENSWLLTQMGKGLTPYWIGLADLEEGQYRWIHDNQVATYTNFAANEPNNWGGNQDCGRIYVNGTWDDMGCLFKHRYICESDRCY